VLDLGRPLDRLSSRVREHEEVKIVAFGSSSTAGAGASTPEASYPAQLQSYLSTTLDLRIVVINRGKNGDLIGDMLARANSDVAAERSDLIIWQVGTNALLTDLDAGAVGSQLKRGLRELASSAADLIVMDPQYAPKVLAHKQAEELTRVLKDSALQGGAAVFQRFRLMQFWFERHLAFQQFLSPDQLHMNDWSYQCLARTLGRAIIQAAHPMSGSTNSPSRARKAFEER